MKTLYCKLGIFKVGSRFPSALKNVVSDPIDKIVDLAPVELGVENFPNLELRRTVHVEGRMNLLDATWKRVGHMRLQKADMEDRMDMHGRGEIESERRGANPANDSKGT